MTPSRTFFWLFPTLMAGLLLVSGLKLAHNVTGTFSRIKADGQEFRQSPGCLGSVTYVNPSLPPCQAVPVTVTGKERQTEHSNSMGRDYNTNSLDVQDGTGQRRHLTWVGDDLWNSVKVGDQITATVWKGRVLDLVVNGSSRSVSDAADPTTSLASGGGRVWMVVFVVAFSALGVWRFFRQVRYETTWSGRGW